MRSASSRPAARAAQAALTIAALTLFGCGGQISKGSPDAGGGTSSGSGGGAGSSSGSGTSSGGAGSSSGGGGIVPYAAKLDLLFMIDNSVSMGDKQTLLALAVPGLIERLVAPNCLDGVGNPTGTTAGADGSCPAGSKAEFAPVHDLHVGIVTSSLGSRGGDVCPEGATNPVNSSLSAHNDDRGELINRTGVLGDPTVENASTDAPSPLNFLSYFPSVAGNAGASPPPTPAVTDPTTLIGDFTALVEGVHEHGCGFEAQNEAWYRFLVQPDPFASVTVSSSNVATLSGIDETILQQRADFLRPDSAVAVVVVTDENEEAADPLSIAGQGWAFNKTSFPGSQSGGGAPEGTVECQHLDPNAPASTGPNDPNCTSCAFLSPSAANFAAECPKDGNGLNGWLDPTNDSPNLRYFHQKVRFGLSSAYPTSRYVRGLQRDTVPSVGLAFPGDGDHEHDGNGLYIGDTDAQANCVNPLFATDLPTSASADLCHLTRGPRSPNLVFYAAIAGVPHELLQARPGGTGPGELDAQGNPLCAAGTPPEQCPQKTALTASDWTLVLGNDPEHYDFRGADFHMVESIGPRTTNTGGWANVATCTPPATGVPPGLGDPGADAINGCEFNTQNEDLQFSCIFPLVQIANGTIEPFVKDCTSSAYASACDCATSALDNKSQLCSSTTPTSQLFAKAYPSLREMIIAKAMSSETIDGTAYDQGVVSSLCPIALDVGKTVTQAQQDPLFGFNPAFNALVSRLTRSLQP